MGRPVRLRVGDWRLTVVQLAVKRLVLIALALCLTGCVDYDLGIRFDSQTHGALTQTLHLSERVAQLNPTSAQQWLRQFEQQTRGKVQRLDGNTVKVTVPFYNGTDLSNTFNALFDTDSNPTLSQLPGSPQLPAHLDLRQKNWLFALRNQISLDIDLTSLTELRAQARDSWRVLNLAFHLVTPWGVQSAVGDTLMRGHETTWILKLGQVNHIEAIFWVPSPIGLGAGAITLVVIAGYLVKYGLGKS